MEADWTTFSPNSSTAPAKSEQSTPYFHEVNDTPAAHTPASLRLGPENNFLDQDHFFLQQIEHNLYPNQTPGSTNGHAPPVTASLNSTGTPSSHPGLAQYTDLNMETFDFMLPEDMQFEPQRQNGAHHHHHLTSSASTAYPPSHLPQNTPSLLAKLSDLRQGDPVMASPILPGQNDRSYNNQHLYHKHSSEESTPNAFKKDQLFVHQPQLQHVRPDAVFTPLVSPAVTPHESNVNINKQNPISTAFEPLTLPALSAQPSSVDRRRSSSLMFAPNDDQVPLGHKRRTPHSTPILLASNKRLPAVKPRNGKVGTFDKLPELGYSRGHPDSTAMLPPLAKRVDVDSSGNSTPATMMGFTMGRLAEQARDLDPGSPHLNGSYQNGSSSNTTSPQLRSSRRKSFLYTHKDGSKSSSSGEPSPVLESQRSKSSTSLSLKRKGEKPATKKASHKLAEQGRRNRMNVAVQELLGLIPKDYHDQVAIPSKATTVELASQYIRALQEELDSLKART